jgi:DNA (cytosine-5)-methyltransferase 1
MSKPLVLSLFPGIGLLDLAFEEEGFAVVRGPDLLWGGDIRKFSVPAGRFDGVIGGPPCQLFSGLANFAHRWKHQPEDLIPEFSRVVREAQPRWFVMENVPNAPLPVVGAGYDQDSLVLNNRWFGAVQDRERRFSFGLRGGLLYGNRSVHGTNPTRKNPWACIEVVALEHIDHAPTVTSAHAGGRFRMKGRIKGYSVEEALALQGVPPDFFGPRSPFSRKAQLKMLAQGVPLPMGRAVARAVRKAMGYESEAA